MKIIIVGCGKIGEELAAALSQEKNDITIIDKNEAVVENLCNQYDIMGTVGNGASYSVQLEADISHADLMIAVTGSDELNLLCCLIAKKAGKNCHTIARVRNPEYNTEMNYLKEELGLSLIINQEVTAAREVARVMRFPSAIEIDTFAKGRVELLRFRIPEGSVLSGLNLIQLHNELHSNILVCAVERQQNVVIPNGTFVLESGDVISIVAEAKEESKFFERIGIKQGKVKRVLIVGGGDVAFYLGEMLTSYGIDITIIEKNIKRCQELCDQLPKAEIIHGDGTNKRILEEADLERHDGFVALTDMDEENVILSLYAKTKGVRKAVTKINHIAFDEVIDNLNLDTVVYPRSLTAEYILQYVRARQNSFGSNVETLHRIVDNHAEALEFILKDGCPQQNIPLQSLPLKPGILIACINRQGKIILPRGKDVFLPGDSVIVVTTTKGLKDFKDIFEMK